MATGTNAQLLALSGKRNPYPGRLGVVEQGALADLLLVDGDPIADIRLIEDPAKNFVVIMKDGKIQHFVSRMAVAEREGKREVRPIRGATLRQSTL